MIGLKLGLLILTIGVLIEALGTIGSWMQKKRRSRIRRNLSRFIIVLLAFSLSSCAPFARWINHEHIPNRYKPNIHQAMILENDKK